MTKLDELVKALNDKGIVDRFKFLASIIPMPEDCENPQEAINQAVKITLEKFFDEDLDLLYMFCEYAFDLGYEALVKELNIQPSEKTAKDDWEMLMKGIAGIIEKAMQE